MDLVNFSLFILSYLIISDFKPWGDSLWELTYLMPFTISQTHVCLITNLVLLNLTLSLTVHFCAVHGYAATHMCITHVLCFSSILPPPHGCIMLLISVMPALDSIGIDWHPQSDSLGVSPLKWTWSTPTLISGSTLSSGKPKAIDLLYWLFHMIRYFCVHVMSSEIWAIELAPQRVCLKTKSLLDRQPSCCNNNTELTQIHISKSQILCTLMYNAVQMSQCYGKVPPCAGHITVATGHTAD